MFQVMAWDFGGRMLNKIPGKMLNELMRYLTNSSNLIGACIHAL